MGNKLLKLFLPFFIVFTYTNAQSELKQIDEIIEKIKIKRVGISDDNIKKLKDPFYYKTKSRTNIKRKSFRSNYISSRYKLYAILNDKAKINGKWYKLGSKIKGFRLYKICTNCVKLKKGSKTFTLYLHKKSKKIKISGN
ncbi:hypothetical protein [Nitrosophilus labii]|uniref:hypothetical protein n=1 Tax=Nitrosophilus labii TaxID=2706014 RepID=UPI001656E44C|nr:hypothetical protein [Nitrosophilus labii]